MKVSQDELNIIYNNLSVQSMLDIKYNFQEVSMRIMQDCNNKCLESFIIKGNKKIIGIGYIFDTGECINFILYSCRSFLKEVIELSETKNILSKYKGKDVYAFLHSDAKQTLKLLYNIGFIPVGKVNKYIKLELAR